MNMGILIPAVIAALAASATPPKDQAAAEMAKMQGDWVMASMIRDGEKIPDEDVQALFRKVTGDHYVVFRFQDKAGEGTFKLDPSKTPKGIDFYIAGPAGKKPMLGIYELTENRLRMCYGPIGAPRPTKFTSEAGEKQTLVVWEKEKK
jgi:uncharacterized protein (TIGR03067 family)